MDPDQAAADYVGVTPQYYRDVKKPFYEEQAYYAEQRERATAEEEQTQRIREQEAREAAEVEEAQRAEEERAYLESIPADERPYVREIQELNNYRSAQKSKGSTVYSYLFKGNHYSNKVDRCDQRIANLESELESLRQ